MPIARPNWWRLQAAPSNRRAVNFLPSGRSVIRDEGEKREIGGEGEVKSAESLVFKRPVRGRRGNAPLQREEEEIKDDGE